jgi:octaprenyl-diphosphate synthase
MIRDVIRNGGRDRLDEIMAAIQATGGLEYTERLAQAEADQALSALTVLPATAYREALAALVRFAIAREH